MANKSTAKTKKELRKEEQARIQRTKRRSNIALIAFAAVVVIIIAAICISSIASATGYTLRSTVAMESENFQVDNAMMSYFFYNSYANVMSYYGSTFTSLYGLDTSTSLKLQEFSEGVSWFDYFMTSAISTAENVLISAEAANAAGLTLSDAEKAAIAKQIDKINPSDYGRGVNAKDITRALELASLASKYESETTKAMAPDTAEIEAYYSENKNAYMTYDYRSFQFQYATEDNTEVTTTQSEALALANELYDTTTELAFEKWVSDYYKDTDATLTADMITEKVDATLTENAAYAEGTGIAEFAFAADTEVGMTYTNADTDGYITVYMVTRLPESDMSETVDVRHILISEDTMGSDDAAKAEAERILALYNENATEDNFAALALEYSEDTGSFMNGGLYENVAQGEMISEFDSWIFDDARTAGDTGIVKTTYGYHVMFYSGDGLVKYQATVSDDMTATDYDAHYEELIVLYPVTAYNDNMSKIPA